MISRLRVSVNGSQTTQVRSVTEFTSALIARQRNQNQSITSVFSALRDLLPVQIEMKVEGVQSTTTLLDHRTKVDTCLQYILLLTSPACVFNFNQHHRLVFGDWIRLTMSKKNNHQFLVQMFIQDPRLYTLQLYVVSLWFSIHTVFILKCNILCIRPVVVQLLYSLQIRSLLPNHANHHSTKPVAAG